MPDLRVPPSPDELEISIFGPSFGESILVHVGQGRWLAIDSCWDSRTKRAAALSYLEKIGQDPEACLDFVVASHWHADHAKGLREVYAAASNAGFSCSKTLTKDEFLVLADLFDAKGQSIPFGPEELKHCLAIASERSEQNSASFVCWATSNRALWEEPELGVVLTALSPSDEMVRRGDQFMVDTLNAVKNGATEPRLVPKRPNDVAVALRLTVGGRTMLFGSDLEEGGDPLVGWSAVIAAHEPSHPVASVYKVAHHGSKTGHHDDIWKQLLVSSPLALLTPFCLGRHRIPDSTDRQRILAHTDQAYISANPNVNRKLKKKIPKVQKYIEEMVISRKPAFPLIGQIRWRAPISNATDPGEIELFENAIHLASV